ncbi:hypothetical protein F892_01265 [Acinetobacter vivianii]|uniref:Uncharacterized protein n=1 Tax=Acinetobacter vivianii TaxID=1776742 RepID=N9Q6H8_9GAMM|nr:hypothetical protein [Acinetobacter vivianii]ENX22025.1 hypothetical protein F892_01265 [Acinetobacter vivianii]MEB6666977.1 hypothetical protein [Acinetobacter vivianii]GGI60943.1 hypothetical protein GCM10011446_24380 [Acinetobacter vivianii]
MKRLVLLLPLLVVSQTYAETLAQFEKKLIQKYANKDFYQVNQAIESDIVHKIENDPASFNYSFPAFEDHYHVRIQFSQDKQLKFYTFDVGGGGTMGEYSSYVQTQKSGKTHLTPVETGLIFDVKQTVLTKKPVYLVNSYYKGSSCIGAYTIDALQPTQTGLIQTVKIFQTKTKLLDRIQVDFDCNNHEGPNDVPDYIRSDKNLNHIDIMLLDKNGKPQAKYLRYRKTNTVYQYIGVVK